MARQKISQALDRRGPIEWPARSPDLTPPDFFLRGYLNNIVYKDMPTKLTELRNWIASACAEIDNGMCTHVCKSLGKCFVRCRDARGAQQFKLIFFCIIFHHLIK